MGEIILMCVKEGFDDYCYFSEFDLLELYIDEEWKECVCVLIFEFSDVCKKCYVEEFGLFVYDVMVLMLIKEMFDFFEVMFVVGGDVKLFFNWLMGEVFVYLNLN